MTYLPYPPRSSTVLSYNACIVWAFGSFALFVQTLASATAVYPKVGKEGAARGTTVLNEQI